MKIYLIAAVALNRAIGKDNKLLYHLPKDLKRFKELTTGHTIIMGRRTFESLPHGALPNRRNIVLSHSDREFEGCEHYTSLEDALAHCADDEEVFIIGGESLFDQTINMADRMYLTEVEDYPEGADAFFPPYGTWGEVFREVHAKDENHSEHYNFLELVPSDYIADPSEEDPSEGDPFEGI